MIIPKFEAMENQQTENQEPSAIVKTKSPNSKPELILFPLPIGSESNLWLISPYYQEEIKKIKVWIAEEARTLRRFISSLKLGIDIPNLEIFELNEHSKQKDVEDFLIKYNKKGQVLGLCSEAGMPCIADPGTLAVRFAQKHGWVVTPIPGPNSLMLTLAASGLNGQNFTFHGYPPVKEADQKTFIPQLIRSASSSHSHLFIEAPYRSDKFLQFLIRNIPGDFMLCIGQNLHEPNQRICTQTLAAWKKESTPLGKSPCVFIIGK